MPSSLVLYCLLLIESFATELNYFCPFNSKKLPSVKPKPDSQHRCGLVSIHSKVNDYVVDQSSNELTALFWLKIGRCWGRYWLKAWLPLYLPQYLSGQCMFQILEGCHGQRTGVAMTKAFTSLILGWWVTKVLKNGDKN